MNDFNLFTIRVSYQKLFTNFRYLLFIGEEHKGHVNPIFQPQIALVFLPYLSKLYLALQKGSSSCSHS